MSISYSTPIIYLLLVFQLSFGPEIIGQQVSPSDSTRSGEVVQNEKVEEVSPELPARIEEKDSIPENESWQLVIDLKNWKIELKKKPQKKS